MQIENEAVQNEVREAVQIEAQAWGRRCGAGSRPSRNLAPHDGEAVHLTSHAYTPANSRVGEGVGATVGSGVGAGDGGT